MSGNRGMKMNPVWGGVYGSPRAYAGHDGAGTPMGLLPVSKQEHIGCINAEFPESGGVVKGYGNVCGPWKPLR